MTGQGSDQTCVKYAVEAMRTMGLALGIGSTLV